MNRHIILLIFVKSVDGGTGTFLESLLKISDINKNIEIKLLILEKPSYRKLKIKNKHEFLRKSNYYPPTYSLSIKSIRNFWDEFKWYKKNLKEFKPDIILGIDVHCNLLISFNKLLLNKTKIILTTHINLKETINKKSSPLLNILLKLIIANLYSRADAIVSISKNLSKELKKDFKINKEIKTIYYGISPSKNNTNKYRRKIVISAGRFVEQKDFDTLIDSFVMLKKELPEYKLWIIGDGPLKKSLINHVVNLNLSTDILFLGWKQNLTTYLKKTSIFVLSSRREGFGYVLLEAMSQGIPVVSTNAPFGPSEILGKNTYGLLVSVGDKLSLKNAMMRLLTNKKAYDFYRKRSIERSNFFSEDKMLNEYKKIIEDIIF